MYSLSCIYFSLCRTIVEKDFMAWQLMRVYRLTFPFHHAVLWDAIPGCSKFVGQVNEAKQSQANPCDKDMRLGFLSLWAKGWDWSLGFENAFRMLMHCLHFSLPAFGANLQARPKSTYTNEVNDDWRWAKCCCLPIDRLSPCRSHSGTDSYHLYSCWTAISISNKILLCWGFITTHKGRLIKLIVILDFLPVS